MLSRGDKIGEYVLLNKLGSGGFGDVWKAEKRTSLDSNYFALKFFRPKEDRIDFEIVRKELAVWKQLKGLPHIISLVELDRFEEYVYIVSDFADGGSLEKWLTDNQGKAESEEEAIKIILQILTGLENLHEKGFVHRDLKPDNILIMNGKFCLADFGVSREIKENSKASRTTGTPEYIPPEGFASKPSVTPETDIWAIGVILQRLLTGGLSFPQEMPALMLSILQDEPEPMPDNISKGVREIVKKALQKNRQDRFQSAHEMRQALKNPQSFVAVNETKSKDSGTIIDEDFDRNEKLRLEAEKQAKAKLEQERLERERNEKNSEINKLVYAYQQHIVNQNQFYPYEIANLKNLVGQKGFDDLTQRFAQERIEKNLKDRTPEEPVKPANVVSQPSVFSFRRIKTGFANLNERLANINQSDQPENGIINKTLLSHPFTGKIALIGFFCSIFLFSVNVLTTNSPPSTLNLTFVYIGIFSMFLCLFFNLVNSYLIGTIGYGKWARGLVWTVLILGTSILLSLLLSVGLWQLFGEKVSILIGIIVIIGFLSGLILFFPTPLTFSITALFVKNVSVWKRLKPLLFPVGIVVIPLIASIFATKQDSSPSNSNVSYRPPTVASNTYFPANTSNTYETPLSEQYASAADKLYKEEKYSEAAANYREAIRLDPKNHYYFNSLGNCYFGQKKYLEAETEYRLAIRLSPAMASYQYNLGNTLYNQQKYPDAISFVNEAIRLDATDDSYYNLLGNCLYSQGKYSEAVPQYKTAIRLSPDTAMYQSNLGNAFRYQKLYSDAVIAYKEAIRLDPNSDFTYYNELGNSLYALKKYSEAEPAFRGAIKLKAKDAVLHNNLGDSLYQQSKYSEAIESYKKAIEINPNNEDFKTDLKNAESWKLMTNK